MTKSIFTTYTYKTVNGKVVQDEYKKFVDDELVEHRDGVRQLTNNKKTEKCEGNCSCSKKESNNSSVKTTLDIRSKDPKLVNTLNKYKDIYKKVDFEDIANRIKDSMSLLTNKNELSKFINEVKEEAKKDVKPVSDLMKTLLSEIKKPNNNFVNKVNSNKCNNKLVEDNIESKCQSIIDKYGYGTRIRYKGHTSDLEATLVDMLDEGILKDVIVFKDEMTSLLSIMFILKDQETEIYELIPTKPGIKK